MLEFSSGQNGRIQGSLGMSSASIQWDVSSMICILKHLYMVFTLYAQKYYMWNM